MIITLNFLGAGILPIFHSVHTFKDNVLPLKLFLKKCHNTLRCWNAGFPLRSKTDRLTGPKALVLGTDVICYRVITSWPLVG